MALMGKRGKARLLARQDEESPSGTSSAAAKTTKQASLPTFAQPKEVIALTTTFTPRASCTENLLTILPSPGYQIWANEPVPFENQTSSACYPPAFLESYTSLNITYETTFKPSSIVPAMSPFVCPQNYCTQHAGAQNYLACCPSGYQLETPATPVDSDRPAYGGTCWSGFTSGSTYPAVAYLESGSTAKTTWYASSSSMNAYAHPIDGFAASSVAIGCPTQSLSSTIVSGSVSGLKSDSTQSSSTSPSEGSASAAGQGGTSPGTIAGAVVGSVVGLAAFIAFVWFVLGYYRKHQRAPTPPPKVHQAEDDFGGPKTANRAEKEGADMYAEMGVQSDLERGATSGKLATPQPVVYEMTGDSVPEMDAAETKKHDEPRLNWKDRQ